MKNKKQLSTLQTKEFFEVLKNRFEKNKHRHKGIEWNKLCAKLLSNPDKLWSLHEMEKTGGEPDVIYHDKKSDEYIFMDCSEESPKGRRSFCYDAEALESRKEFKTKHNAIDMANEMGVKILTEQDYRMLQEFGEFDTKTSSWLQTPDPIRKLGGAIFGDKRYDSVFIYHNGAQSYYAARGFRALLRI